MLKEKNVFVMSKETYMINMFLAHYKAEESIIDPDNNPTQAEFREFYMEVLLSNPHVIDFDGDVAFIVGCKYNLAKPLFGKAVCSTLVTKSFMTDLLVKKFNVDLNEVDYNAILEAIEFTEDFKTKEDIENWIEKQESMIKQLKELSEKE